MTPDQETHLNLLSDGLLYEEANALARQFEHGRDPTASQLNGLLAMSQSWENLEKYVKHQAERAWQGPRGQDVHPTKVFYEIIRQEKLQWLRQQAEAFIADGLSRRDARVQTDLVAARLAQEFIQHLVAELLLHCGKDS